MARFVPVEAQLPPPAYRGRYPLSDVVSSNLREPRRRIARLSDTWFPDFDATYLAEGYIRRAW